MSNSRAGPVPSTFGIRSRMTVTKPGVPSPRRCFHLCSPTPQDADSGQVGGISVDQLPGLFEGYLVDQIPADVQGLRDRGNAHAVNRQALEDPAGAAVGELGFPL